MKRIGWCFYLTSDFLLILTIFDGLRPLSVIGYDYRQFPEIFQHFWRFELIFVNLRRFSAFFLWFVVILRDISWFSIILGRCYHDFRLSLEIFDDFPRFLMIFRDFRWFWLISGVYKISRQLHLDLAFLPNREKTHIIRTFEPTIDAFELVQQLVQQWNDFKIRICHSVSDWLYYLYCAIEEIPIAIGPIHYLLRPYAPNEWTEWMNKTTHEWNWT